MNAESGLTRRSMLSITVVAGAGLTLGCITRAAGAKEEPSGKDGAALAPNSFVSIAANGAVSITVAKPDIGTGVRTSLAMIVAEELGIDLNSVKVIQAPGDGAKYGGQGVGGSGSVRGSFGPLRQAGATAAEMLKQAAAQMAGVDPSTCRLENGRVQAGNRSFTFAELVGKASQLPVPSQVQLKPKSEFKLIGKPTKRVDNMAVVTGKAGYGMDSRVPGMKFAAVARPPAFGSRAASFDSEAALKVTGVREVKAFGSGVAVIAETTWAAIKGRKALNCQWTGGNLDWDSARISAAMKAEVVEMPQMPPHAAKTIDATYELPFLSHAPMEPQNCTAHVTGDGCKVWAPTQVPDRARDQVAQVLGISPESVEFHVTLVGGGFGRRLSTDAIIECINVARMASYPVQLVWTRDDDIKHDNYRPANLHVFRGAIDSSGAPIAAYQQAVLSSGRGRGGPAGFGNYQAAYRLPNCGTKSAGANVPVPTGAWRSVENTYQCFVTESFLDELCAAGGNDPLAMRKQLIQNGRLRRTLDLAGEKANWGTSLPKGFGRGVACFNGYGSCITQIFEVEVKGGIVKVHRVTAVVDCGLAINPLGVQAQVEGGTMDAIATTLYSAISIAKGGVVENHFLDFGWAQMTDAPTFDITVLGDGDSPGGMGEVGYPAAVPALCNAIFAATGKRIRTLPVREQLY